MVGGTDPARCLPNTGGQEVSIRRAAASYCVRSSSQDRRQSAAQRDAMGDRLAFGGACDFEPSQRRWFTSPSPTHLGTLDSVDAIDTISRFYPDKQEAGRLHVRIFQFFQVGGSLMPGRQGISRLLAGSVKVSGDVPSSHLDEKVGCWGPSSGLTS